MKKIALQLCGLLSTGVGIFLFSLAIGRPMTVPDFLMWIGIVVALSVANTCFRVADDHPWPFTLRLPRIRIEWPE